MLVPVFIAVNAEAAVVKLTVTFPAKVAVVELIVNLSAPPVCNIKLLAVEFTTPSPVPVGNKLILESILVPAYLK